MNIEQNCKTLCFRKFDIFVPLLITPDSTMANTKKKWAQRFNVKYCIQCPVVGN